MLHWLKAIAIPIVVFIISTKSCAKADIINSDLAELQEMLNTEKVLVDTLRHYIENQERKLSYLKRKAFEIRIIHDGVIDREKFLYNPINALAILKRFTADWRSLESAAKDYLQTEDLIENYSQQKDTLVFPAEDDYDAALINLLRIQDLYQLDPQRLAVGVVNGVKLGSDMTWSDCLEIGLKSIKSGFQTYAKYWMITALEKLSNAEATHNNNNTVAVTIQAHKIPPQDDYVVEAKWEIMKALLNMEYKLGNLKGALEINNKMLELQPQEKHLIDFKNRIEKVINKLKQNHINLKNIQKDFKEETKENKLNKIVEELMMEEFCRKASHLQAIKQIHTANAIPLAKHQYTTINHPPACAFITNNLPFLYLMPLKFELLSLEPFIVIYHNVLSDTSIEELKDFIDEKEDGTFEFLENDGPKKIKEINRKLHYIVGHYGQDLYDDWHVELYNFENIMDLNYEAADRQAKLLFNLQEALMGGAVIFPQLELTINLPRGSLLYLSNLNEHQIIDFRTNYHICPVIAGTQITASTSIKLIN